MRRFTFVTVTTLVVLAGAVAPGWSGPAAHAQLACVDQQVIVIPIDDNGGSYDSGQTVPAVFLEITQASGGGLKSVTWSLLPVDYGALSVSIDWESTDEGGVTTPQVRTSSVGGPSTGFTFGIDDPTFSGWGPEARFTVVNCGTQVATTVPPTVATTIAPTVPAPTAATPVSPAPAAAAPAAAPAVSSAPAPVTGAALPSTGTTTSLAVWAAGLLAGGAVLTVAARRRAAAIVD